MPLPFTGLQAFHWGDGVKVLFLYIVLVIVVIGDDVVDGVDVEDGGGDEEVGDRCTLLGHLLCGHL